MSQERTASEKSANCRWQTIAGIRDNVLSISNYSLMSPHYHLSLVLQDVIREEGDMTLFRCFIYLTRESIKRPITSP
jgi:hypothetical protein